MSYKGRTVLVWIVAIAFTWPIFRSGLKGHLTFIDFIKNHTIYGDPVEYVPKEDYVKELQS